MTGGRPFENESIFLSIDSRATQRRKGKKSGSRRLKTAEHEDPEIEAKNNKGKNCTNSIGFLQISQ